MTPFSGIPDAAFEFYAELEHNNNRDWWLEHKSTYDAAVKEPLTGLLASPGAGVRHGQALPPQPGHPLLPGQVSV